MKEDTEIMMFQTQIQSAMQNLIPWETLILLLDDFCITFEKARDINYVLLEELKTYKISEFQEDSENIESEPVIVKSEHYSDSEEQCTTEDVKDEYTENIVTEAFLEPMKEIVVEPKIEENSAEEKTHFCDLCQKTFKSISALRWHTKKFHESQQKAKCDQCGKSFEIY